jgi:hypothetical protein
VSLSSRFRIAADGIHVSHFNTQLSGIGGMSGQGTVDAAGNLDFQVTASMAEDGLLNTAKLLPGSSHLPHEIPLLVRGTAAKPLFAPDPDFMKNLTAEKLKNSLQDSLKDKFSQSLKDAYTTSQVSSPCSSHVPANNAQQVAEGESKGKFHGVLRHMAFWRKDKKQDSKNNGKSDVVAAKY